MPLIPIAACLLVTLVTLYTDIKRQRIPNPLTISAALAGLCFQCYEAGLAEGGCFALQGLALGVSLLFIPFLLGGMGGGDVKLLGALGAWLGPADVAAVFFYTAVAGSVWALWVMLGRGSRMRLVGVWFDITAFLATRRKLEPVSGARVFPYTGPMPAGWPG
ncbi:MAG: A24 family peptidase [Thermodesulfobacteriota bacterium]|nr:A24 family peptidase [Thermodesulfobacteriota bacterium]